jgi:hypothetical protein
MLIIDVLVCGASRGIANDVTGESTIGVALCIALLCNLYTVYSLGLVTLGPSTFPHVGFLCCK